jgi:hypothetical protein
MMAITEKVEAHYPQPGVRKLRKYPVESQMGIYLGWTTMREGEMRYAEYHDGIYNDTVKLQFVTTKTIKVAMVMPVTRNGQYIKPFHCPMGDNP